MRLFVMGLMMLMLAGCGKHQSFYGRQGDVLEKSPCVTQCQGEPFYQNGRWLDGQ